jgi:putative DNA primase/helicase
MARSNNVKSLSVSIDQFDKKPWLLACKNAVIDLRTGEARPGRPDDFILKASPADWWGIDHPAPTWESFLYEISEGKEDIVSYLGRMLGYAIAGLTTEHIFVIFTGQGRNGKGTLIDTLIKYVLGPLAAPIQTEMLLSQRYSRNAAAPSPDIMALQGLRIAFTSETDEDRYISPSRVKWLTGGDVLVGRSPNDKYETHFIPTHTLIMSTNHMPHASSDDFALWERIHLVPFNLSFVDRKPVRDNERRADKTLPERLGKEAPGILAWLVRGCLQWQKHGLYPPAIVVDATHKYQRKEDILGDFIDECLIEDPASEIKANQLYEIFKGWWEENMSKNPWSVKKFGQLMSRRYKKEKHSTYIYYGICSKNRFGRW